MHLGRQRISLSSDSDLLSRSRNRSGLWSNGRLQKPRRRGIRFIHCGRNRIGLFCRLVLIARSFFFVTLLSLPFLGLWGYFRSPQLRRSSGHVMRKDASLSTATMRRSRWTCLSRQSWCSSLSPFTKFILCRTSWLRDVCIVFVVSLHVHCVSYYHLFSSALLPPS